MRQICIFFIFSGTVFGQTGLGEFILKNAKEVKSISFHDTAYADLQALGDAIKDHRVVMLGEMWHGDGAAFEAKSRIIRFLHEKHHFNVLAFESDFYSLTKGFEQLKKQSLDYDSLLLKNIFAYWSKSIQCSDLFNYLKTDSSFKLCGIDNQLKGEICKSELKSDLQNFIHGSNIPFLQSAYYKEHFWSDFDSSQSVITGFSWKKRIPFSKTTLNDLKTAIDSITFQLRPGYIAMHEFEYQTLINNASLCDMFLHLNDFNKSSGLRDAQMSSNLAWIVNKKYPSEKIIVWLASSHMVKNNQSAYRTPVKYISMGSYYSQIKSNPPAFALGFTSDTGHGNAIGNRKYKIPKTKTHSIESYSKRRGSKFLFVSLKDYQPITDKDFHFSKIDGGNNLQAQWHQVIDAVFYIETMTPATQIPQAGLPE